MGRTSARPDVAAEREVCRLWRVRDIGPGDVSGVESVNAGMTGAEAGPRDVVMVLEERVRVWGGIGAVWRRSEKLSSYVGGRVSL